MCGIWAWLRAPGRSKEYTDNEIWEKGAKKLSARGPEGYAFREAGIQGTFCFTRLAINGLNPAGMQPFFQNGMTWMCNGEIYNAPQLNLSMPSGSDCEVLGPLWHRCERDPLRFARALDGVFAIVLYDSVSEEYIVARDPYGVRPLFYCVNITGDFFFASERKALESFSGSLGVREFPPGQVWRIKEKETYLDWKEFTYHTVPWIKMASSEGWEIQLRAALEAAVQKRLMTERACAALLSGGLDSSLVAALVQRALLAQGKPPLKTFSIGMPGSTDLKYARLVADHIGSDHTEILTSADEMFDCIPEVIRDIESYDITTVRASVGNWMVARAIQQQTDCKVVFNGDGSDEVFGGYLYFYRAPSDEAFESESERLLAEISRYDVLRSDRSISSHGLEPRTPFLDKQFVAMARSLPTELRRPSSQRPEKWALRTAFAGTGLLPDEVLWRKKEAFSDGVSSEQKSWYQEVQERIDARGLVPPWWRDELQYLEGPQPQTPEAYYYRKLFDALYTKVASYWPFWMPRWSGETSDPSARTLSLYQGTK